MKNSENLNALLEGPVEDQVFAYRKASQGRDKLVTGLAHKRVVGQRLTFLEDAIHKAGGGAGTIKRNISPNYI